MNKNKAKQLLSTHTNRWTMTLPKKFSNKLVNQLKALKKEGALDDREYRRV